jgi:hypothetical protein
LKPQGRLAREFIRAGDIRAVVAGEENHEDVRILEIGETIRATIGGFEREVRRGGAEFEGEGVFRGKAHALTVWATVSGASPQRGTSGIASAATSIYLIREKMRVCVEHHRPM